MFCRQQVYRRCYIKKELYLQLEMSENDQEVEHNFTEYLWSPLISKLAFVTDAVIWDKKIKSFIGWYFMSFALESTLKVIELQISQCPQSIVSGTLGSW